MCLAIVALDVHPRYALVIAANRDEFHARPALPAAWGVAPPFQDIVAGRDLEAGGTWLGVRRDGRWALVTNVRDPAMRDSSGRSRGELPPLVINSAGPPADAIDGVMRASAAFNGFNLLCGDTKQLAWASNRQAGSQSFARGVHALSNALLDTPWPKVVRTRNRLDTWLATAATDTEPLFEALGDRALADDHLLPATGVTREWERQLSAAFIVGDRYGTRCTTVVTIDRRGRVRMQERTFGADGTVANEVTHTFVCA